MNPKTNKVPVAEVIIHWAEGKRVPIEDISYPSFESTDSVIQLIASDERNNGMEGYCKLKYTVKWAEGSSWTGRLDITGDLVGVNKAIARDVLEKASFDAGISKPDYMSVAEYNECLQTLGMTPGKQNQKKRFISEYELL